MQIKQLSRLALAVLILTGPVSLRALAISSSEMTSSEPAASTDLVSSFSISEKTQVPGLTLKPGSYSIRVVDRLTDRVILRIDSAKGDAHTTFLGLRDPQLPSGSPGATGQIEWNNKLAGKKALRGFTFPGGTTVEFVYPKADAVAIATANANQVPAIDPASENRVVDPTLSKDDMELVTLWMLSSTRVGPSNQPAIEAQKFKAAPEAADTSRTAISSGPRTSAAPTPVARTSAPKPVTVAENTPPPAPRRPVIAALPHTAGYLPLVELAALLSLLCAGSLRLRTAALARSRR